MSDDITALHYYVTRLEEDLAIADNETERLRKYSSKQALDIATLGQEVGRLREALEGVIKEYDADNNGRTLRWAIDDARAALAEKGEK